MKIAKTVGGFFFLKTTRKKKENWNYLQGVLVHGGCRQYREEKREKKRVDPCSVVRMTEKTIEEFR